MDERSAPPRVSIGMPVYNGEEHICEAIGSILAQTFSDFELIIADNCSEDRTESICREYVGRDPRVRYFRHATNLGASKNFTFAFDQSRGEYFKWAAHDDVMETSYLQRCVETLDESGPRVVLCFPQRWLMTYEGRVLGPDGEARWFESGPPFDRISFARLMRVNAFIFPMFMFGLTRRDVLAKTRLIGPYEYSDLVLVAELRLLGEFREIADLLFYTRVQKQRRKSTAESVWLDPANTGARPWPEIRLFYERLKAVRRCGSPWYRKPWYYASVLYGHFVVRSLHLICWQMRKVEAPVWRWWEMVSASWMRRERKNYLPYRVWVLLSGLRNWDRRKLALAFGRATPETRRKLVEFVADKLGRRQDHYAKDTLRNWLNGPCPIRKAAAASAASLPISHEYVSATLRYRDSTKPLETVEQSV